MTKIILNLLIGSVIGALFVKLMFDINLQSWNWELILEYIDVLAWPFVLLLALLFFRKVLSYLFFSLESFNFFGARGKLKNVQEMIIEKADELHIREQDQEYRNNKQKMDDAEIAALQGDDTEKTELTERAIKVAEELNSRNKELSSKLEKMARPRGFTKNQVEVICALFSANQEQREALTTLVDDRYK